MLVYSDAMFSDAIELLTYVRSNYVMLVYIVIFDMGIMRLLWLRLLGRFMWWRVKNNKE